MGLMHCDNKDCNAVMMSGDSKCHSCGKKTYFYLKHPQAFFIMAAILVFGPIFYVLGLVWKVLISPLTLTIAVVDAVKYKYSKNHLNDDLVEE
jgi:hypothetical protein